VNRDGNRRLARRRESADELRASVANLGGADRPVADRRLHRAGAHRTSRRSDDHLERDAVLRKSAGLGAGERELDLRVPFDGVGHRARGERGTVERRVEHAPSGVAQPLGRDVDTNEAVGSDGTDAENALRLVAQHDAPSFSRQIRRGHSQPHQVHRAIERNDRRLGIERERDRGSSEIERDLGRRLVVERAALETQRHRAAFERQRREHAERALRVGVDEVLVGRDVRFMRFTRARLAAVARRRRELHGRRPAPSNITRRPLVKRHGHVAVRDRMADIVTQRPPNHHIERAGDVAVHATFEARRRADSHARGIGLRRQKKSRA
jgi:hypothetical protein